MTEDKRKNEDQSVFDVAGELLENVKQKADELGKSIQEGAGGWLGKTEVSEIDRKKSGDDDHDDDDDEQEEENSDDDGDDDDDDDDDEEKDDD